MIFVLQRNAGILLFFLSVICICYRWPLLRPANIRNNCGVTIFAGLTKLDKESSYVKVAKFGYLQEALQSIIEPAAKSLFNSIKYKPILVPNYISDVFIDTSYVQISANEVSTDKRTPLVLLHGFDSSFLEYRRFANLVATDRDVFIPDILGWGFTNCSTVKDVSPKAKLDHLKCFIEQVVGGPCILVGASLGGTISINLATEVCPQLVEKLILVDGQGFIDGKGPSTLPDIFAKLGTAVLKSKPLRMFANYIAYYDKSLATDDAMNIGRLHCLLDTWDDSSVKFVQSGGFTVSDKVPLVKQPTLVIWGRNDEILELSYADRFKKEIQGSQVEIIDNCGHVPHLEKPVETARLIQTFLQNNK